MSYEGRTALYQHHVELIVHEADAMELVVLRVHVHLVPILNTARPTHPTASKMELPHTYSASNMEVTHIQVTESPPKHTQPRTLTHHTAVNVSVLEMARDMLVILLCSRERSPRPIPTLIPPLYHGRRPARRSRRPGRSTTSSAWYHTGSAWQPVAARRCVRTCGWACVLLRACVRGSPCLPDAA